MRLVEWNEVELRVNGSRIEELMSEEIARRKIPVDRLNLVFREGEIVARGRVRKGIPIPFRVLVRRIDPVGSKIRVVFAHLVVFGLPLTKFFAWLTEGNLHDGKVLLDARGPAIVIQLDAFLPMHVDATIDEVRLVDGGIEIALGPGGADPPAEG